MLPLLLFSPHVLSDSFATPWTVATRLRCPWNSPVRNTGVACHFLLQGIFPTQESNPHLLLGRWILYHWAPWEAHHKQQLSNKTRVLVPPQGIHRTIWHIPLSCSVEMKTPTQVEDDDYMLTTSTQTPAWLKLAGWWLRKLKHHPVNLILSNQKKVHEQQHSNQMLPLKTLPWNPLGSSGLLNISCLFSLLLYLRVQSLQSRLPLCNSMDCIPPASSVHDILRAREFPALGTEPASSALQVDASPLSPLGSPLLAQSPAGNAVLHFTTTWSQQTACATPGQVNLSLAE